MDGDGDFHDRLAELAGDNRELVDGEGGSAREGRGRTTDIQLLREIMYALEAVSMGTHQLLYFSAMKYANKYLESEATDLAAAVDELADIFDAMNLGTLRMVDPGDPVQLELEENAITQDAPESGRTMCYFIAGYIAGFLENCLEEKFVVNETACTAEGNDTCVFRVQQR